MSGWDQASSHQQSFYNPEYSGFYGNYGPGRQQAGEVTFMTPAFVDPDTGFDNGDDEFANEPPLLEELGINLDYIAQKTMTVLNPFRTTSAEVAKDSDLAGPLVFCLAFGSLLLLSGKLHFNHIYGIGLLGCIAMYGLLSIMSDVTVGFGAVVSVLGYCILPIVILSAFSALVSLQGIFGTFSAIFVILWCSASASNLFVTALNMDKQQLLIAYPCSLLYAVFALITIF